MQPDKMRVYALAKQLDADTKVVLDICKELGYDTKNQLSNLDAEQAQAVTDRLKRGNKPAGGTAPPAAPAAPVVPQVQTNKVQTLTPTRRPRITPPSATPPVIATPPAPVAPPPVVAAPVEPPAPVAEPVVEVAPVAPPPAPISEPVVEVAPVTPPPAPTPVATTSVAPTPVLAAVEPPTPVAPPPAPVESAAPPVVAATTEQTTPAPAPTPAAPPATPVRPAMPNLSGRPTNLSNGPRPGGPAMPSNRPANLNEPRVRNLNSGGGSPQPPRPSPQPPQAAAPRPGPQPPQAAGNRPGPLPPQGGNRPGVLPPQGNRPAPGPLPPRSGGIQDAAPRPAALRGRGPGGPSPYQFTQNRPSPSNRPSLSGPGGGGGGRDGNRPGQAPPPPAGKDAPKTAAPSGARKLELTAEMKEKLLGGGPIDINNLVKQATNPTPASPAGPAFDPSAVPDDDGDKKKAGPGRVLGRDTRRVTRDQRAQVRKTDRVQVEGGQVVVVEDERHVRSRDSRQRHKLMRVKGPGTVPRKGKVTIQEPISVRGLSEAIGLTVPKLITKLVQLGMPLGSVTINSFLEADVAELVAVENGVELEIRKPQDAEDDLIAQQQEADDPTKLVPRAPIVTIMGHVDHGKTSLLDRIRQSNVVSTEAGGITQVIRAWRVEHDGKPITFLDTPGHEAFTAMRARGAQVTDIAVIVCAANDGVKPQTEEAISHAKAAGVKIVVAINKVDLPDANLAKTRQQLYSLDLLPDDMGGDVPFVETSAAKGTGIAELLEAISLVAELQLDLKANPDKPARGVCLEAHLSGDEGVFATVVVQDGTLRKGDIVLCGATHGRVRAMYNDLGRSIAEAGPSVPVRITGLDAVPDADDPFQAVSELHIAREIAEKRQGKAQEANLAKYVPMTLDKLGQTKVSELKVILKADFRGSVEAIRKELEKLEHDEVRVRLLHAGIGAITVSDVQLALTSPGDSLVIGFNCVPDDDAMALAQERGIKIREYDIIYKITEDLKAALEGRLKPREEIVHLGRAVVRNTFKISKVGTVAGCYVTQGTIERSAKVRLIREGVVIFPPAERTASLDSLKRFKEDTREVKQGFECGIKLAGYDDLKVDDVIEAYRVEQVLRTL